MLEDPPASSVRADDPIAARIGTVLADKWTLEGLLGAGAMAAVYVGRHRIGRRDAIKILHPEIARDTELAARFEQEAHAVNCLTHPGAVEIHDIGETADGEPFLVMELLEGQSLADRIEAGALELPEVLRIIDELLDVLGAAHAAEIIHRDIKPDNLFLLGDGRLKVLDFGIARVRRAGSMKVVTQLGAALGTPSYMSQEQIKGLDVDHRADLFAAGAVLFELLTGQRVHQGDSEQMVMVKMLTCPAPPLASVAPDLPEELCAVVDRALGFEAADRYPDAATMQADLRALREGRPPRYASPSAPAAGDRGAVAARTAHDAGPDTGIGSRAASPAVAAASMAQPTPALVAIVAALGLTLGIAIVLWAACSGETETEEQAMDASSPDASIADADHASPAIEAGAETTAEAGAETSAPEPSHTSAPARPLKPPQRPNASDRKRDEERRKKLERERKKREKKLERERKKREKKRRK